MVAKMVKKKLVGCSTSFSMPKLLALRIIKSWNDSFFIYIYYLEYHMQDSMVFRAYQRINMGTYVGALGNGNRYTSWWYYILLVSSDS